MAAVMFMKKFMNYSHVRHAAFRLGRVRCGRIMTANDCRHIMQDYVVCPSGRFLATAAPKITTEEQQSGTLDDAALKSIEEAFTRIDFDVRRTGRVNGNIVKAVFNKLKFYGTVSSLHGLYLIRCCGRLHAEIPSKKMALVNEIWDSLNEFDTALSTDHYNALLKVYLQNDVKFSPMEFLSEMEKKDIQPNNITYQLFVENFCNYGDLSGASIILEYMKEKDIAINEEIFNSLIKCHIKMNDSEGANNILEIMKKSDLYPTSKTYTILACGFAEAGNMEGVNDALLKAQNSGIVLSNENYIEIITSLCAGGQSSYVDRIMKHLIVNEEYKQDIVTAIMNLTNKGFCDVAYKFVSLLGPSNFIATANLFIKQMTKTGQPVEAIIDYCKDLEKNGHEPFIYLYATNVAIDCNLFDHALALIKEREKQGLPVRMVYFNSILENYKKENKLEEASQVLKLMYELGIPCNFNMYFDWAELAVNSNMNPTDIIAKFEACGHSSSSFAVALLQYYCDSYKIDHAKYLIQNYPIHVSPNFKLGKFISAHEKCKDDPENFFQILEYIVQNTVGLPERQTSYGNVLIKLTKFSLPVFEIYLKKLYNEGITLNEEDFLVIQNILREKAPNFLFLLQRLNGSSSKSNNRLQGYDYVKDNEKSIDELERHLSDLKNFGHPTGSTLYKLLLLHINMKNVNKVSEIMNELEAQNFKFGPIVLSQLMNLYAASQDLEKAEIIFKSIKDEYPDYKCDSVKLVNYATTLIKQAKHSEAVDFVKREFKNAYPSVNQGLLIRSIKNLLITATDTGDVTLVKNLYELIVSSFKFIGQEHSFMDSLVKVHLLREDLYSAISEYRDCAMKYKAFPCRNLLLRKCIFSDNPTQLQRVIDITTLYDGESVALCELAGILLETGRANQAKKVLQNLGRKTDIRNLESICDRFVQQNRELELKHLIIITQDLWHIDRDKLYYYLFKLYAQRNNYKKALEALSSHKRENLRPSANTVELLSKLLQKNNQLLPFDGPLNENSINSDDLHINNTNEKNISYIESFLKCVDANHTSEALEIMQNMKKGHVRSIPLESMTKLIGALVKKRCIKDLSLMVHPMSYIIDNAKEIVRPLLEEYAVTGDVDACNHVYNNLPDFLLKKIHFNFYLSKAYISSERYEDLLSELENRCNKKNMLFSVFAFEELLKKQILKERVLSLAQRYMDELKFDIPLSVIWAHYFSNEDFSKAEDFYKLYPVSIEKVDSLIIKAIRNTQNIKLGRKFIDFLIQHDLNQTQKDRAYRSQLDALVANEMYKDASNLVAECERQRVPVSKLSRTALIALKSALERENMEVAFAITEEVESSDSSSDSD